MNIVKLDFIHGKIIRISEMLLKNDNDKSVLSWKLSIDGGIIYMSFHNVSRISLNNLSAPLEIQGFEIVDHSQEGWAGDSRYEIHDYEEDSVSFFCEDFDIIQENS